MSVRVQALKLLLTIENAIILCDNIYVCALVWMQRRNMYQFESIIGKMKKGNTNSVYTLKLYGTLYQMAIFKCLDSCHLIIVH